MMSWLGVAGAGGARGWGLGGGLGLGASRGPRVAGWELGTGRGLGLGSREGRAGDWRLGAAGWGLGAGAGGRELGVAGGRGLGAGAEGWDRWGRGLGVVYGGREGGAGGWGLGHGCDTPATHANASRTLANACERFANALATIPGQRLDPWTPTFKTGTLLLRIRENLTMLKTPEVHVNAAANFAKPSCVGALWAVRVVP